MTNKKLNEYQHYYKESALTDGDVEALWQDLSGKLPKRQYHRFHYVMQYAVLSLIMILFFGSAMVAVQAATPDTPLYPLKSYSVQVAAKLSGRYDTLINTRTDEIINAAQKKSDSEIQKAAEEYQAAVTEAKAKKEQTEKEKETLKETLKESETKLRSVTPLNQKAKNAINKSIRAAEQSQKEVKGSSTSEEKRPDHPEQSNKPVEEKKLENPGNSENAQQNGNAGGKNAENRKDK